MYHTLVRALLASIHTHTHIHTHPFQDTLSMSPASDFYKKLALDCSSQQIAVDLFAFGGQFMDLTTIACISKFSSGQVLYYPEFHQKRQVPREKFEKDFK